MFNKKHKYFVSYAMKKGDNTGFGSLTLQSKRRFCTENKQEMEDYICKQTGYDNVAILFIQKLRR